MSDFASVESARQQLLDITRILDAEEVSLLDALGRVLAEDAISDIDVSPFDNSAMDGFAVRAADITSASIDTPVLLEVVAHIAAGEVFDGEVAAGTVARIMTGAPTPVGADAVVMVEDTTVKSGDGGVGSIISFIKPVTFIGHNIRRKGEEVAAGEVVLHASEVLGPAGIGLLAATGHPTVKVRKRPRVAVVSTGAELVEADIVPGPGQIRNSNSYSISAQVIAAGAIPVSYPCIDDTYEATKDTLVRAADECDFVITSGGVSVGDFDYVKPVLEEIGMLYYCNVNMRPGKPQTMGVIDDTPFFGLPGNPTSTYVGFEIFVRPALRKMQGYSQVTRPVTLARITHDAKKHQGRRYFLRGVVERDAKGDYYCSVVGNQSSALLRSAHEGNCLIVLPEGMSPVKEGTIVECIRLDIEEEALA
jgi:molybdopterin molybdotransferase